MITVINPGLLSSIQDEGRKDYLAFGLPRAGVMDRYAARMANLLCGNSLSAAVLEMSMLGGSFLVEKRCRVAICGAEMGPRLNGELFSTWASVDVLPGDRIETGYATKGCRAYLAVSGGFDVPLVMGSRSTYTRSRLGGIDGRPVKSGDRIPVGEFSPVPGGPGRLTADFVPEYGEKIILRVMRGPQDDYFSPEGIATFLQSEYRVTNEADRMGYRLEGPQIKHRDQADIVSDALCPGAIQVPGFGQPIILMVDCGTTGGYPKIATVIGSDIWKVAQARANTIVVFSECTEKEALQALKEERERYCSAARSISDLFVPSSCPKRNKQKMILKINNQTYQIEVEEVEGHEKN